MTKRKVGPMRPKTKEAMVRLAEIMVKNYKLEMIKGTPDFLEYAIHEAQENDLGISWQTIKLREQFLEMKCDELYKEQKFNQEIEEDGEIIVLPGDEEDDAFDEEDENWYWSDGMTVVEDNAIIRRALRLIEYRMNKEASTDLDIIFDDDVEVYEPKYNMFYLSEDGLTWLGQKFRNQPVGTPGLRYVNSAGIITTERTHARYMLSQTPNNYTKDDIDILTKVATGTYD